MAYGIYIKSGDRATARLYMISDKRGELTELINELHPAEREDCFVREVTDREKQAVVSCR